MTFSLKTKTEKAHSMPRHKDGQLPISRTTEFSGGLGCGDKALKTDKAVYVMTQGKSRGCNHRFTIC